MSRKNSYSLETEVVHYQTGDEYNASVPPLYQTATFKQQSLSNMGEYDYTRSGNPTRTQLQNHLAKIMRADHVYAVSSGMTCLDVITKMLKPGDEVIAGDDLYGGSDRLLTYLNNKGDIKVKHIDTTKTSDVISAITEKTAMIFLESPTNPLFKVVDVRTIAEQAHIINPNVIVVFDNTMLSPVLMCPLDLGVDIHYESGTKFLNGQSNSSSGVIATRSAELAEKLYYVINASGSALAPFESWLLLVNLKTLYLRVNKQQENAVELANWLSGYSGFKVYYPGLESHPGYELQKSMSNGSGAVLSLLTGDVALLKAIVEGVKLFGISVSFGGVSSSISMPFYMSHASIDDKKKQERGLPEDLIRISVGVENAGDLIRDFKSSIHSAYQSKSKLKSYL